MSKSRFHPAPTRRLPQHPNLEQLRKQEKDLLEQYRSGDSEVMAEVQNFERNPDPSRFALHDAQRVLARTYGYESWPKLKAFVDGVNIARFAEAVKTSDLARAQSMLASRLELIGMDRAENVTSGIEENALKTALRAASRPQASDLMPAEGIRKGKSACGLSV